MSTRPILSSLVLALALVTSACSDGDGDVTSTAGTEDGSRADETGGASSGEDESDPTTTDGAPADSDGPSGDEEPPDTSADTPADDESPGDEGPGDEGASDPDDPEVVVTEFVGGEVPIEVEKCVVAGIMEDSDLLRATVALGTTAEMTDLELDDQLTLLELSVDCAGPELFGEFMADGFTEGAGLAPPEGMGECFAAEFSGPDGTLVMAGLVSVGNELAPDAKIRGPIIDALTECVPASFMADAVVAELIADPVFEDAADLACISAVYETDVSLEPLWAAYVDAPTADFADLSPDAVIPVFGPLFDCISFGTVVAAEAAADGVDLSAETIACIDDEMSSAGLFEAILAGEEPDEETLGVAILGCLSPEELVQMAG